MATARTLIQRRIAGLLKVPPSSAAVRQVTAYVYGNRRRCGAHARSTGRPCEAPCWVRADGTIAPRCKLHGGKSTGPKTEEGKNRSELARIVGYYRWLKKRRKAEAAYWRKVGRALARREAGSK